MNAATNIQAEMELVPGNVKEIVKPFRQGTADVYMVSLDAIRVRPEFNEAREADPEYPTAVREIADSIKANGFFRHKPIKVAAAADGYLYVSDGHTRWDAVLLANSEGAGIEAVPVINEVRGTTEEDRIFGLILDNSGRRLTLLGEAMVIKRLIGRGIDEKEIARRLTRNVASIRNALTLVAAPKAIKEMVTSGAVSATSAVKVMKEQGANAVAHLQAAKEAATAAGKMKVTPKALKSLNGPKQEGAPTDATLMEWLALQGNVAINKLHLAGEQPIFRVVVVDLVERQLCGEGEDIRTALKRARELQQTRCKTSM
ncbi:ParB/RepB/Spo0J family partition protein [Burkholderia gladioli]|uniref:ParB/RepB/Spo0J family partition protein n=1 Tax=Burkholderia gladioli TaxID=28095 RepID=UPI0022CFEBAA|nr:ParB N-terminal domain-containing protein [Burkholderia gladioli]MDA0576234.1 ParB/RepB/Spo0J family partition protein [Burkholderia gladioli]MDA0604329.1 ParB/RepB/Spo0J family partition protein [Burkholderia gladioli]